MQVGFIGVGMMGGPMCGNLLKQDHAVRVHDINPDNVARATAAGAQQADSPRAAAEGAEVVFTSLPMPADVEEVLLGSNGVVEGAKPGTIVVDLSTNAPAVVQALGSELSRRGVALIDAPVSGGVQGAADATLAIMCGGEADAFEKARPLLEAMGKRVVHVGPVGAGSIAKLVNNMAAFANMAVACEALSLATRAGLDPAVVADVMQAGSAQSFVLRTVQRKGLKGDWEQEFALNLAHKDLTLALELGRQTDTPLAYGSYTYTLMQRGRAHGWGREDIIAMLKLFEDTGTEVRG